MSHPPDIDLPDTLGEVSMLDPALSETDSLDLADVNVDVDNDVDLDIAGDTGADAGLNMDPDLERAMNAEGGLGQVVHGLRGAGAGAGGVGSAGGGLDMDQHDEGQEGDAESVGRGGRGRRGNNNPQGKNGHKPSPKANEEMKAILERYFAEGMTGFKDINERLAREHGQEMAFGSASSFYRTTAALGVGGTRKARLSREELAIEVLRLAQEDEQGSVGYRNMTRKLREKGILVPRDWVYQALRNTDATGIARRRPKAALLREIAQQASSSLLESDPAQQASSSLLESDPATLSTVIQPTMLANPSSSTTAAPTTSTSTSASVPLAVASSSSTNTTALPPNTSALAGTTSAEVSPFGPFRRVLTSHDPTDVDGSHVKIHDDLVPLAPVLQGNAFITPLFSHAGLPTTSSATLDAATIQAAMDAAPGVVMPGGVNGRVTDVQPNYYIPMHRTNSVDYNIVVRGEATLITPDPDAQGGVQRTLVREGEMVIQRGTLHAWEAGPHGARWITVVVPALPVEVGGTALPEVDFK